jgi:NADH-quinone oxidoreductase subunit G
VVLHPRRTRLRDVAEHVLCRPGDEAWLLSPEGGEPRPEVADVVGALREAGERGVVIAGPRLSAIPGGVDAARQLAGSTGARFAYATRRANDRGALIAGVHPSLLPGGRRFGVDEERADVEALWGPILAAEEGRGWRAILEACAAREVDVLFLIGVDPLRDYPDAALARRALENVPRKVVQSLELGALGPFADAFLPAAPFLEKDGHVTTWEGRSQRLRPIRGPKGISLADWEILASLALAAGGDLGFESLDELHEEMGHLLRPWERTEGAWSAAAGYGPIALEEGQLALFTYPLLVDEGRLSERADELKAALEDDAVLEVHPDDASSRGLIDGGRAVVRTSAGEAELPVRVTPHVAQGSVFVPFNQPGFAANALLSGTFTTAATVEPLATANDAEPATADAGVSA